MGKKLGLDDKYRMLEGYKPAPRVRGIDPGLVGGTMGALGPKGRISTLRSTLGPKGRISTLSAGRPAGMSKIKKLGIIGTGSVAAGAVMGPSMKKDYDEMTSSDSFKKGREEGAAKAKSQMDDMYNKLGKITGYITGKMYGGSVKKYLTGAQIKIAKKAPPYDKIDGKDFAVLKQEKAKGRGQGLQDEKLKPGKVMKAKNGVDVSLKEVYALANRNKSEDRVTEADIKNAKKVLGYKDALPEVKANSAKYGKFMKKGGMSMKDKKIKKVMGEFKKGELNIGKSKKKVKSKKQAIAIALASARKKKA